MGIFGRLIGGGVEKPGNVAAFVIVVSLIGLIVVVFYSGIAEKTPLYGLFGGLITTSLGYIFGRSGH